jgi:hypothetical protein
MIPKSGNRFPACAKPWHVLVVWPNASAGEGRSDKIMRKQTSAVAVVYCQIGTGL